MRRVVFLCAAWIPALALAAPPAAAGRWQGRIDIPARPLSLVVDLA